MIDFKDMEDVKETINVQGARVHNLKNIDVEIPRGSLTVITGLSGSGKSSLAFDTIFAEGQRRYIETFSAYARNFLGGMERPDVKAVEYFLKEEFDKMGGMDDYKEFIHFGLTSD